MKLDSPFRHGFSAAFVLLLACTPSFARTGPKPPPPPRTNRAPRHTEPRPQIRTQPNPEVRLQPAPELRTEQARPEPSVTSVRPAAPVSGGAPHLQQWMENHKNVPLPELQRDLQNEPGFRELPPQVQQRQLNTLGRLYNMDPQQRARVLNRVEGLERLNPQQQQQWGQAVQQLNAVPTPRRRLMTRAIVDLREMPSAQRQQVIDSPAFAAQFSADERQTIRTVLTAY